MEFYSKQFCVIKVHIKITTDSVADLEDPPPPPSLFLVKREEITEARKSSRVSKSNWIRH